MDFPELVRLVTEGDAGEAEAWTRRALQDGAEPYLGQKGDGAAVRWDPGREGEEFHRAGQHEHECGDDAEEAQ